MLVVEDDDAIRELMAFHLDRAGYEVRRCAAGREALAVAVDWRPDLVLLDLMLPDMSGLQVCRELARGAGAGAAPGIIIVTALGEETDRVVGLETGADDYVTKPFSPRELVARAAAVLRRRQGEPAPPPAPADTAPIRRGRLVVDPARHRVSVDGQEIELTPIQFDLLLLLAANPGVVFDRDRLLSRVWGDDFYGERRTVDVHVWHIRRRLEPFGLQDSLETVRGVGYRLRPQEP